MAQISAIEELQDRIDDGEYIEDFISIETEAGRFRLTTYFEIEAVRSKTGKLFYTVEATTKIGGSSNRKITSRVVLAKQEGNLYDGQQESSPTPTPDQPIFIIGLKVLTPPNKLEYIHGDEIDTTGLTLEILYNDGNREVIDTGYTYAPSHADYSNPALRVECTKGGYTASAYIPLTVHRLLTNLALIREQDQKDSYKSDGKAKKGYILIPVSAFFSGRNDEDISNSYAYVNLFDSLTPGGETISGSSTSNNSIRIQTDVNAPEVAYRMANTKYAVYLTVTDASSIAGIEVTLTPTNGTNAGTAKTTTYTQKQLVSPIVLESGTNYTMRVVAKDVAGHVADVTKTISYSSGIAGDGGDPGSGDPGSADQPVDFTDTEGGVYSYKTRKGNYYLVGSSEKNTDTIKGSCKSFFYYGQDIA